VQEKLGFSLSSSLPPSPSASVRIVTYNSPRKIRTPSTRAGEIHELKEELRSLDKSRKKDSVKKVIAA